MFAWISFFAFMVNPFEIDMPAKKEHTFEDYETAQALLRKKEIGSIIKELYTLSFKVQRYTKEDFTLRCSKGFQMTLIDRELNRLPVIVHLKSELEAGLRSFDEDCWGSEDGDPLPDDEKARENCVVLGCSYDRDCNLFLESLVGALREIGYKGGIYYRIGGYPNPSGDELRYAGVPYAFKVFMVQEALALGYKRVLWLDTAVWPLQNLDEVFQEIEESGFFFDLGKPNPWALLPKIRKFHEEYSGENLASVRRAAGWIMGFSAKNPLTELFFYEYRKMVALGFPFISVNPEEAVITSILLRHGIELKEHKNLMLACTGDNIDYMRAKRLGLKFIVRAH